MLGSRSCVLRDRWQSELNLSYRHHRAVPAPPVAGVLLVTPLALEDYLAGSGVAWRWWRGSRGHAWVMAPGQ